MAEILNLVRLSGSPRPKPWGDGDRMRETIAAPLESLIEGCRWRVPQP